jgi:hypothetical protein
MAAVLQPTTLHCCPLATLPMETVLTTVTVLQKLRFDLDMREDNAKPRLILTGSSLRFLISAYDCNRQA